MAEGAILRTRNAIRIGKGVNMIVWSGEQAASHPSMTIWAAGKPCVDGGLTEGPSGWEWKCDKDKDSQGSKGSENMGLATIAAIGQAVARKKRPLTR